MAVTEARDRPDLLHGHPAALRTWAAAGADLVLGGHIHLPYTLAQQGLARRLWVVQAGTAVSWRTRPEVPKSVNILRWRETFGARGNQTQTASEAGEWCLIEQWDFARHDRVFVRTAVTPVQPERGWSHAAVAVSAAANTSIRSAFKITSKKRMSASHCN
jgi:hypothetical protein